jgi:hypothetical protein
MVPHSGLRPCWGTSEDRWLRFADEQLRHLFPYLPKQSGYNKRPPRLVATLNWPIGALARDTRVGTDDVWVVESTAVDCARSRGTVRFSDLAGGPNTVTEQAIPATWGCARPGRPARPAISDTFGTDHQLVVYGGQA